MRLFCFSAKLILSLAICSVRFLIALSVLVLVLEAINLPVSYLHAVVIVASRSSDSEACILTEYSGRSL